MSVDSAALGNPAYIYRDAEEGHANSLAAIKKWFGETPVADEVLAALK